MTQHSIPWRDNGLFVATLGAVLFAALVAMEYVFQELNYQEPVLQVDLVVANDTDSEEAGEEEGGQLSADDVEAARHILTVLLRTDDKDFVWSNLQQQFPQAGENIWLDVAESAAKRKYTVSADTILNELLATNPQSLPVLFQHAKLAQDDTVAIERYRTLLEKYPNHQTSLFNVALLLARKNLHDQAITAATRAIEASSGTLKAKAFSVRASSYFDLGQYTEAAENFHLSLQFRPAHASTWRKLATTLLFKQVLFEKASDQEVLQAFDQAVSLQTDYLQALHERGQFHWLRGNLAMARRDLEKVRAVAPDFQQARWTLLHLYLALEKRRSAREEIRWLRSQDINSRQMEFIDGLAHWSKQNFNKAREVFATIDREKFADAWLDYYSVLSLVRAGEPVDEVAIARLNTLRQQPWMTSFASTALAETYLHNGQDQLAIAVLQELNTRHPESHYFAYTLGRTYLDEDFYSEAASALQRAVKLDPTDSQTQLSLGVAYARAQQFDLALLTYESLLQNHNNHRAGRYNYALLLERLNRDDEAVAQLQQLLQIDPTNTNAQYRLANLYAGQKQYDQAIALLKETLAELPTYHRARELLAEVQQARGQLDLALHEVDRLLILQSGRVSASVLKSDILKDLNRVPEAAAILLALPEKEYSRNTIIKLYNIGKRALDKDLLALAESCNRKVVSLDPDYDKAWVNLTSALNRQRQYQQTVNLLVEQQELLAKNYKLVINLAQAYHLSGESQAAIALLEPLQQQNLLGDEGALVLANSYRDL